MRSPKSIQTENLNLIRKVAWSFKKSTRESFDDLFQEGYIGYMIALDTYTPEKGNFSTYAWMCISNKIKDYLKFVEVRKKLLDSVEDLTKLKIESSYSDFFEKLPEESLEIVKIILTTPKAFAVRNDKEAKLRLLKILMVNYDWPLNKVCYGFYHLTIACK